MTIVNEALFHIDTVVFDVPRRSGFKSIIGAVSKNIATPPENPAWPWTGKAGQIAYFDKVWRYIAPNRGLVLFVKDEQSHYIFTGDGWQRVKPG
jgi:beta-lactamase superfamily II metal-dependent hydrolase